MAAAQRQVFLVLSHLVFGLAFCLVTTAVWIPPPSPPPRCFKRYECVQQPPRCIQTCVPLPPRCIRTCRQQPPKCRYIRYCNRPLPPRYPTPAYSQFPLRPSPSAPPLYVNISPPTPSVSPPPPYFYKSPPPPSLSPHPPDHPYKSPPPPYLYRSPPPPPSIYKSPPPQTASPPPPSPSPPPPT